MILRELFEARAKSVGIIFGRFNPPHQGHRAAWEMASENSIWYVGTNKSTQGPKDPLPFDIKVKAMQAVYPEIKGHIVAETSWLTLASKVYEKHGNIVLNVYTDEDWVTKALVQYNGKEGAHGYYEFGTIQQQPTPRLSSATALRAAVAADDRDAFGQAAGVDPNTLVAGHPFFDVVKHYLMPHAEKAAKKKVKEPVAEYGDTAKGQKMLGKVQKRAVDRVVSKKADTDPKYAKKNQDTANAAWDRMTDKDLEELSSNMLGRYKKAASDDASKADKEGDYARGNKRFSGIVKATKKQFANDEKGVAEGSLGEVLPWPVVANKITSAMKAMGWKAQRKGDDAFLFSTKGAEDESQYYMVMIDNEGNSMFSYALGTFEGGRPDIGEQGKLPTTAASVSEVLMAIRDGYGLDEGAPIVVAQAPIDVRNPKKAAQTYRNQGDIVPDTKPPSTEKRGVKGRPGQRPMPKYDESAVAENAWDRLQREKALESAGVGIITKQNTTVDVNKNTPKKNLKAFRLA